MPPIAAGALAGLAAALQRLTGEELLAMTALMAAVGVALLALLHRNELRPALPYTVKAAGAAFAAFAIIAAYPLAFQFLGPQRVYGNVQQPDVYLTDLLAFVIPSRFTHFPANAPDNAPS